MLRQIVPALALLLCVHSAGAEEFPESPDQPSAFTTRIDAREYDDRFETVEDLLDHSAGVRVRRYGALGGYSTASIRGSKSEQVLVLLDGVRLNSAQRGEVDLSTIPLRSVERIEIMRGAGSARYGSGAMGGVISITTRQALEPEPHADASFTTGSYSTLGGDVLLSGGGESWRASGSYSRLKSDNDFRFDTGFLQDRVDVEGGGDGRNPFDVIDDLTDGKSSSTRTRRNADFLDETGALRATLFTGVSSQLDSTVFLHRKDRGQPGRISSVPALDSGDDDFSCTTADEAYRRGIARLAWSDSQLGAEAAAYHRFEKNELHDPDGKCGFVNPDLTGSDRLETKESESGAEARFAPESVRMGGVRIGHRFSGAYRYTQLRGDEMESRHRWVTNLFAQQEVALFDERLRLFPALGFEAAGTSSGEVRSRQFLGYEDVSIDEDAVWIPRVGAILRVLPGLRLKANYLRAYRRPSFTELFHPDWGFIRGNPRLDAEDSWNFDAGFEFANEGSGAVTNLSLEGVYFRRRMSESIEWVLNASNAFVPVNTGRSHFEGYELQSSFTVFDRLDLSGSYTYTDAELDRDSSVSYPQVPEHAAFARASLRLRGVRLWSELSYEDEIAFGFAEPAGRATAEAVTQIDAGIALRPSELPGFGWFPSNLGVSVEWSNLTEEQRVDSLDNPLPKDRTWILRIRGTLP
jgi:iron complex outermembrane receptor protein